MGDFLRMPYVGLRRQEEAQPIFHQLMEVGKYGAGHLSKEPIGKALFSAKHQLPQLAVYLEDGCIHIDNNLTENAIPPLALGRKNCQRTFFTNQIFDFTGLILGLSR
jgi:hypothetical protein